MNIVLGAALTMGGFIAGLAFYALLDAALPDPKPHCEACGEELKGR